MDWKFQQPGAKSEVAMGSCSYKLEGFGEPEPLTKEDGGPLRLKAFSEGPSLSESQTWLASTGRYGAVQYMPERMASRLLAASDGEFL